MRRVSILALLVAGLSAALALASCGGKEPGGTEGGEGEPIVLGSLSYNVGISRFLNPDDTEDHAYLTGQPPAPSGSEYFGVFIQILNDSDQPQASASDYTVVDTLHNEYKPIPSDSPYALDIGAELPGDGQVPVVDTTAQTGPNEGSLILFRVNDDVSDNRPLLLEIGTGSETGEITLDI
ncbi:MAG: hypothetical protein ACJ75R_08375 [Solirubrobacterales bacterium]